MDVERFGRLGVLLRAITLKRIGMTIMGLAALAVWGLLFGSGLRSQLVASNTLIAAYAGAWLVSPLVLLGWLVARRVNRGQALFRWLSAGTFGALVAAYWVILWGHSLVDQVGSLPMTVFQGAVLLAPLILLATGYMLMGSSRPVFLGSSSSSGN